MIKLEPTKRNISSQTLYRLCSAIMDSGFMGSADDYFREIDGRDIDLITEEEAGALIAKLEAAPGSLFPVVVLKEDNLGQLSFY